MRTRLKTALPHRPRSKAPAVTTHSDNIATLLKRAAALVTPMLAVRGQSIIMGPMAPAIVVDRKPCRLVALLAAALQELSSYTTRNGAITCMVLRHAIVLRGENPIIMPESALSADWLMMGRAKALGITPTLSWDQGRGPLLTLTLPAVTTQGSGALPGLLAPA